MSDKKASTIQIVNTVASCLALLGGLWSYSSSSGAHVQELNDHERRISALEQGREDDLKFVREWMTHHP